MKKTKDLILVLTLVVTSAAVYFYFHKGINKAEIKKALLESPGLKGMLVKVDEGEQLSSDKLNQQENLGDIGNQKLEDYKNHRDYFHETILSNPAAKELYHNSMQTLGNSPQAQLVAEFISEGLARRDTPVFAKYMEDLISELNAGNKDVADLLVAKEKLLQVNKFQYQMVLNMVYMMKLPADSKIRLFGGAVLQPYVIEKNGSISPQSTNIGNAMILIKNSNLPKSKVFSLLKLGLIVNKRNPAALKEFQYRANAYFPEMIDSPKLE
jgi:hypothetical protein